MVYQERVHPYLMRRIDRYLLSEMIVPGFVGGVLVVMLLVGNQLYTLLRYLYQGVPVHDVLLTLWYYTPGVLMLAIPAALLLGTALGLNRLERDRELLAARMAGVRLKRLVLPIIMLGVIAWGVMFYLQERVIPTTTHKALQLSRKLAFGSPAALVPRDQVFKAGDYFIYVREVDPSAKVQTLRGVMIVKPNSGGGYPQWLTIPIAENHNGEWLFRPDPVTNEPPRLYYFLPNGDTWTGVATGKESGLNLPQNSFDFLYDQRTTAEEFTFKELRAALHSGMRGRTTYGLGNGIVLDAQHLHFYLHRKIAAPLAALVAILIAIPLSVHFGRSGGYVGLLLSVVVAFVFIISQQWSQVLAENNYLHPVLAAWAPNAIFGLLGVFLLFKEE